VRDKVLEAVVDALKTIRTSGIVYEGQGGITDPVNEHTFMKGHEWSRAVTELSVKYGYTVRDDNNDRTHGLSVGKSLKRISLVA
jgi:hypothetical protein